MKEISVKEAVSLIKDGSTVSVTGFVGSGCPEYVLTEIEEEFLVSGKPKNLTVTTSAGVGDRGTRGLSHFGHLGLTKRAVCGHFDLCPSLQKLVDADEIEAYLFPQGTLSQLYREIGSGRPGVITKIGLKTFVDPRLEGGKCTSKTKEDLIEVVEMGGEDYLWYKSFPIDVAIIRGTAVDEKGNLSMAKEATFIDQLYQAQAAKRSGGIVIVQVERIVSHGSINPRDVLVPGILIDYVVVAPPEKHRQTFGSEEYNGAWAQEYRVPMSSIAAIPLNERKIVARRSALELIKGATTNLGFGMPECISMVASEEGIANDITMTVEVGFISGVPAGGLNFGGVYNPDCVFEMTKMFDFYDGGGLEVCYLGAAEVDQFGNVNVSKFKKTVGPGGFINIAQTAANMFFCGTLTAGGLKVEAKDGKLTILQEGRSKKYVNKVQQVTFSGEYSKEMGQNVLYITERAVFKTTSEGLMLIEIAPGIDLQTQVLDQMEFDVKVSPDLKLMDERIFRDEKMGLVLKEKQ